MEQKKADRARKLSEERAAVMKSTFVAKALPPESQIQDMKQHFEDRERERQVRAGGGHELLR